MKEREYQRARLGGEVLILNGVSPEKAKAVNICLGGMCFRANGKRPVGQELELLFTIPPNRRLKVVGRVVRVSRHEGEAPSTGIAVKFVKLEREERAEIENYVRKTARILKALFFELNRPRINEKKVRELAEQSSIVLRYPINIMREKVMAELANLKLRAGHKFRK